MNFLTPAPQTDVTGEEVMRDWFYQIGLFTVPQFLKPEFCAQLRAEVRQYLSQLAQVGRTDEVQVSSCFTILTGDHWSDWDRRPQPTAGRLANYLDIQIHNFVALAESGSQIQKLPKNSNPSEEQGFAVPRYCARLVKHEDN